MTQFLPSGDFSWSPDLQRCHFALKDTRCAGAWWCLLLKKEEMKRCLAHFTHNTVRFVFLKVHDKCDVIDETFGAITLLSPGFRHLDKPVLTGVLWHVNQGCAVLLIAITKSPCAIT